MTAARQSATSRLAWSKMRELKFIGRRIPKSRRMETEPRARVKEFNEAKSRHRPDKKCPVRLTAGNYLRDWLTRTSQKPNARHAQTHRRSRPMAASRRTHSAVAA